MSSKTSKRMVAIFIVSALTAILAIVSGYLQYRQQIDKSNAELKKEKEKERVNQKIILLQQENASKSNKIIELQEYNQTRTQEIVTLQNELQQKTDELNKQQQEIILKQEEALNYYTGENSFAYVNMNLRRDAGQFVLTVTIGNIGKYPLRNIDVQITNITKQHELFAKKDRAYEDARKNLKDGQSVPLTYFDKYDFTYKDFQPDYKYKIDLLSPLKTKKIGNEVRTEGFVELDNILIDEKDLREFICFNVKFTLLSGTYIQRVKFKNSDWSDYGKFGHWYYVSKIYPNEMNFSHEEIGIGYLKLPIEKESDVDWWALDKL